MSRKGKPKITGIRYRIADGTVEELPLVQAEEARLRQMAAMLSSPNEWLRERGEEELKKLAHRLSKERAQDVAQKRDSSLGAEKRREAGNRKAALVQRAAARGTDPLDLVSERHLRRIKARKK